MVRAVARGCPAVLECPAAVPAAPAGRIVRAWVAPVVLAAPAWADPVAPADPGCPVVPVALAVRKDSEAPAAPVWVDPAGLAAPVVAVSPAPPAVTASAAVRVVPADLEAPAAWTTRRAARWRSSR